MEINLAMLSSLVPHDSSETVASQKIFENQVGNQHGSGAAIAIVPNPQTALFDHAF